MVFTKHVNTTAFDGMDDPSISGFNSGDMFMVWSGTINGETKIYGHHFSKDGTASIVEELELSNIEDFAKTKPQISTNKTSLSIASWEDGGSDGSNKGIFGQRFEIEKGTSFTLNVLGQSTPFSTLGQYEDLAYNLVTPEDSLGSVVVSVIDTGVDTSNVNFKNVIWKKQDSSPESCFADHTIGYNIVEEGQAPIDNNCDNQNVCGHGTSINGIIASDFPSDIQLELMNIKVKSESDGNLFHTICAIFYAIENEAKVINMSLGFEATEAPEALRKALDKAYENDILVVTSSGNTSKNNDVIGKLSLIHI